MTNCGSAGWVRQDREQGREYSPWSDAIVLQRIGDVRERLEIEMNQFDRVGGDLLADRGHRQDRLRSFPMTRACGRSLHINLQNSIPSARKLSAYRARPVTLATMSGVM